jgi:sugar phosphate isomerase/epimerase
MPRLTRREWHKLALSGFLAGVPRPASPAQGGRRESRYAGVLIGVQSYSFRDRDLDGLIAAMTELGLTSCELWEAHVEPRELMAPARREELRRWRLTVPLDHFRSIHGRFASAGIDLNSYNLSFKDDFADAEIERGFLMAGALGVNVITASAQINSVPRIARAAARHGLSVAMHNHSRVDPNEFSSPDDFAKAMAQGDGRSIVVNLDIGHFTAAGHDAIAYLRAHHDRIATIHLKDRRRQQGPNVPWGEGDTPIRDVLTMLRKERWPIPANIEYEYRGDDTIAEVRRCLDYCRKVLSG